MRATAGLGIWALLCASGCYSGLGGASAGNASEGPGADADSGEDATAEGTGGDHTSDGDDGDPAKPDRCGAGELGTAPMRRLTATQFAATVTDLFGGAVDPGVDFPVPDASAEGFSHAPEKNVVSLLGAEKIQAAAEGIAEQVVASIETVAPCEEEPSSCADAFIRDFGRRAFRRPLRDDESALLRSVYDDASAEGHADGVAGVVAAALQMPQFLYLIEEGEPVDGEPDLLRLTDYEVAARLSYLLWDGPPDDGLRLAADAGELGTPAQVRAQAERMLASARAEAGLTRFYAEWLGVSHLRATDKNAEAFPGFDDALVSAMQVELEQLALRLHQAEAGTLTDLLTTSRTRVDASLAAFYGLPEDGGGAPSWDVELPATQRSGILTLPAVLSAISAEEATNAIRRGKLVRERVLCDPLPPPPPDAESMVSIPPGATEAEKWEVLRGEPACAACHVRLNPLGLGFEHYDAIGAWRDEGDDGQPIDAAGHLGAEATAFDGVPELAARLAGDADVARCFAAHWLQYTWGRVEQDEDECVVDDVTQAFDAAGQDLNAVLVALAGSDAFLFRTIEEGQ